MTGRRHTDRSWVHLACLVELTLVCGYVVTLRALQLPSQEGVNIQLRMSTEDLQRRVTKLESDDYAGRLRVLESDMTEVKWLARGAAAAVMGQLLLAAGVGVRRRTGDVEEV